MRFALLVLALAAVAAAVVRDVIVWDSTTPTTAMAQLVSRFDTVYLRENVTIDAEDIVWIGFCVVSDGHAITLRASHHIVIRSCCFTDVFVNVVLPPFGGNVAFDANRLHSQALITMKSGRAKSD
jgi:hypothetical protein